MEKAQKSLPLLMRLVTLQKQSLRESQLQLQYLLQLRYLDHSLTQSRMLFLKVERILLILELNLLEY